jgi:hypothetical protein
MLWYKAWRESRGRFFVCLALCLLPSLNLFFWQKTLLPGDRADAIKWLEAQLAAPRPGVATVVFHSIVLLYFTPEARARMMEILHAAGGQATPEAPLAWLSMEPNGREDDVFLTLWPGGRRKAIASAGYHGGRAVVLNPGGPPR